MKEAKEFAESIAAIFIETSARNAVNIEELFQKISMFPIFLLAGLWYLWVPVYCFGSFQGKSRTINPLTNAVRGHSYFS